MRTFVLAMVAAMAATSATAADLGNGLALNTEIEATYNVDATTTVATINPEFAYSGVNALTLTAGTTLTAYDNTGTTFDLTDEFDHLPVLEFGAAYAVRDDLTVEALVDYDLETETRGDLTLVATFNF